jgi:hypothetical protein
MNSNLLEDPETLRSYLLGQLTADDADTVECRLLEDTTLFELAEAVEGDLLAACARGDLSPADRDKVIRRLAASPRGRARLAVAEGLNALANGASATKAMRQAVVVPFIQRTPLRQTPTFRAAAMAAGLVLVMAGAARLAVQTALPGHASFARNEVAATLRHAAPPPPAVTPAFPESSPAERSTPPAEERVATIKKAEPPSLRPAVSTVVQLLALSVQRSAQERSILIIPAGTRRVEIQLPLNAGEPFTTYRATVLDATSDAEVWRGDDLSPSAAGTGSMVVVSLPAAKLPQGSYRIELRGLGGDGGPELVGAPSFDVRTP